MSTIRENEGELLDTAIEINKDGRKYMVPVGSDIILHPGESLSLYGHCRHKSRER